MAKNTKTTDVGKKVTKKTPAKKKAPVKAKAKTPIKSKSGPKVKGTTAALTKFGTVVVTVDLIFVPNCSEAMVTNNAQYPALKPKTKAI